MWEYPARWEEISAIPDAGLMSCYTSFFTQVDARDSAQAFEKALLAPYEGSHPLFINDTLNPYLVDSRELARLFFAEAEVREALRCSMPSAESPPSVPPQGADVAVPVAEERVA